jgi:D-alanyl-D-alanine carboxypeptidase
VKRYFFILVAAAGIGCGQNTSPTAPVGATPAPVDLKAALSAAFDKLSIPASAACSVSSSQYGQVVLERGRGQIAPGREASADSHYRIASLTKPITATAVLISELAGRLSRTDKINQHLAFPEPAPTIDELIKHVPGLSDYLATAAYQNGRTSPTTVETLLSLIQPWDGVRRYKYSNSHAVLSGAALQKVNGLKYEAVVQRDIFGPAGMSQSSFELPPSSETFAYGTLTHPTWNYAAGGVTSTAPDMNRFNQALLNNAFGFGALESFDRSVGVTSFGMGSSTSNGELRFTHVGLVDTYGSMTVIYPADRSSVVVLCNDGTVALPNFVNGPGGVRSLMLAAK